MLSEFVTEHRDEIIARCRERVAARMAPRPTQVELEHGIPLFLRQLEHTLASELGGQTEAIGSATQHGGALMHHGFTIAQVVHDYGDVCQTITQLSIDHHVAITTEEFRALNKCLDDAIADAVTEYERQREIDLVAEDMRKSNEHLGFIAHELRNVAASALLAYEVLRTGTVGIAGSTGDVLGRSLIALRDLIDRSLTEVRLNAGITKPERILLPEFIDEIDVSAALDAKARGVQLSVTAVAEKLVVFADRQILASVLFNLLQNGFKFTRPHSRVRLRTHATADHVLFEIEDQCGGLAPGVAERLFKPFAQATPDHSGLGLGLTICARGVAALQGRIRVHNANSGCVFTVELPRVVG
ncbi:MAG TPA: HAMP domain-containing sensor histidine kinase [Kofleriaceae bacterium]